MYPDFKHNILSSSELILSIFVEGRIVSINTSNTALQMNDLMIDKIKLVIKNRNIGNVTVVAVEDTIRVGKDVTRIKFVRNLLSIISKIFLMKQVSSNNCHCVIWILSPSFTWCSTWCHQKLLDHLHSLVNARPAEGDWFKMEIFPNDVRDLFCCCQIFWPLQELCQGWRKMVLSSHKVFLWHILYLSNPRLYPLWYNYGSCLHSVPRPLAIGNTVTT